MKKEPLDRPRIWKAEEWDNWWKEHENIGFYRSDYFPFYRLNYYCSEVFEEKEYKTALFVGNGISQEPQEFCYAGYKVIATDISPYATNIAMNIKPSREDLTMRFQSYDVNTKKYENESWLVKHKPGGEISFVIADINDPEKCLGQYDVVVCRRVLQYFENTYLQEMCKALVKRLSENGCLIIEIINNEQALYNIKEVLKQEKLKVYSEEGKDFFQGRGAWIIFGTG